MSAQSNDNSRYLSGCEYTQSGENDDELNSIKSGVQVANVKEKGAGSGLAS